MDEQSAWLSLSVQEILYRNCHDSIAIRLSSPLKSRTLCQTLYHVLGTLIAMPASGALAVIGHRRLFITFGLNWYDAVSLDSWMTFKCWKSVDHMP